jgi:RND superfamily putative drug exporter
VVIVVIMASFAIPYFGKNTGMSGIESLPDYLRSKQGYLVMQKEFHIGMDAPAIIVIDGDINSSKTQDGIALLQSTLKTNPAFVGSLVEPHPDQNLAVIYASVAGDPGSARTMDAVSQLRTEYIPQAFEGAPVNVLVTGYTAGILDFNNTTNQYTPIIFAFVLALSFVILTLAFRSLVISTTAIIMNMLSVGAAYGLIVLVFQKGIGNSLFGFMKVDVIESWLPLFLFALLFGLSMDYHVFLLSRIRERFQKTGDNAESVSFGLRSTGRLITGAALIMVAVFWGFALAIWSCSGDGFRSGGSCTAGCHADPLRSGPRHNEIVRRRNWYLPKWLRGYPMSVWVSASEPKLVHSKPRYLHSSLYRYRESMINTRR